MGPFGTRVSEKGATQRHVTDRDHFVELNKMVGPPRPRHERELSRGKPPPGQGRQRGRRHHRRPLRRRSRPDVPGQARSLPLGRRKPGLGPRPRSLPRSKPRRPPGRPPAARTAEEGLDDYLTIPKDRGIFLPITWRLSPNISSYTSDLFYESLLTSKPGLENQVLAGAADLDGSGLHLREVPHEGNRNSSDEEIEAIAALVSSLTSGSSQWFNQNHEPKRISGEDILVVAPYNAQVTRLAERLAPTGARVGTVDKFQGQEAAIVIYSMATSRPEDAPRGMEFLYSLNRLNVATSRARCAAILVLSPQLLEPECKTPRQMRLANALCRFREIALRVPNSPSM